MMIKNLLVVEDDYFMRAGLCGYLTHKGHNVISARHAAEAMTIFEANQFDVAIVDIVIPENNQREKGDLKQSIGLHLVKRFKEKQPKLGVVILSAHGDRKDMVLDLFHSMMDGIIYQVKGSNNPDRLEEGIRMAALGYTWIEPCARVIKVSEFLLDLCTSVERPIIEFALNKLDTLTPRERDVLDKVSQARTTERISKELVIVKGTVDVHISKIYDKLFNTLDKKVELRKAILLTKVALINRARQIE